MQAQLLMMSPIVTANYSQWINQSPIKDIAPDISLPLDFYVSEVFNYRDAKIDTSLANRNTGNKTPISVYNLKEADFLEEIVGAVPEDDHCIELNPRQQRLLGLYYEDIPVSDENPIKMYFGRVDDKFLVITTSQNELGQIVEPRYLFKKTSYGKDARKFGERYYQQGMSEQEKIQEITQYRKSLRGKYENASKIGDISKVNFNLPEVTDRPVKFSLVTLSPKNARLYLAVGGNYIEGALQQTFKDGIETINLDDQVTDMEAIKRQVKEFNPDVIGLSVKVESHNKLTRFLDFIQKEFPDKLVVLGGTIPTNAYKEVLDTYPNVLASLENGEEAAIDIVRIIKGEKKPEELFNTPNLAFKQGDDLVLTKSNHDYKFFLPSESNVKEIVEKDGIIALRWSQGCWGKCTFCTIPGKWQSDSLDNLISTMKSWKEKFGVKSLNFTDDEIVPKDPQQAYERLDAFADRLIEEDLDMQWYVNVRADSLHFFKGEEGDKLIEKLKKSGCIGFYVGIETGSETQLKRFGKKVSGSELDVTTNSDIIKTLSSKGIPVFVGYITTDPLMPTLRELKENMQFFHDNNLTEFKTRLNVYLMPQKGSSYPEMIANKKLGLLGDLQPNLLVYDATYLDPRVGAVKEHLNNWIGDMHTVYERTHVAALKARYNPDDKQAAADSALGVELRQLTLCYIEKLMKLFPETDEDKMVDERVINKTANDLSNEFWQTRRTRLIQEVQDKQEKLMELFNEYTNKRDKLIDSFNC